MTREPRRDQLTSAYRAAHRQLMTILYNEDPEGMGASVGAPEDEYSRVATRLLVSLNDATTVDQARSATLAMYSDATEDLISQVLDVWRRFTASTASDGA